jgi:hypothetical protein
VSTEVVRYAKNVWPTFASPEPDTLNFPYPSLSSVIRGISIGFYHRNLPTLAAESDGFGVFEGMHEQAEAMF